MTIRFGCVSRGQSPPRLTTQRLQAVVIASVTR
uniref:Uncharacterized protein n=1 Tax=Anopheles minimus TaxID=112268 RepID=A0A182WP11_9DIPT